mmetsp:Transcript_111345/g.314958  ORF Transcript_111345/g.314958 Transcript_111345/m.314958 type:complete len:454 (+) Transcript_111345:171-1532(+)|eukprot:CAMPEP_0168402926 /NCGR_PEP_ID=MMETSP0228-20121227/23866_1 /TAXON_ID=133427 /ORGANISM="Protoceratium reticulatum, Strain CCCM 535 (=CCMP 1889)" /LENGTH=453 /DNA_ID=CAMNT_0008416515 /DNA_START=129 /DNA_END=1490 /DNA_ORIENTATION=-
MPSAATCTQPLSLASLITAIGCFFTLVHGRQLPPTGPLREQPPLRRSSWKRARAGGGSRPRGAAPRGSPAAPRAEHHARGRVPVHVGLEAHGADLAPGEEADAGHVAAPDLPQGAALHALAAVHLHAPRAARDEERGVGWRTVQRQVVLSPGAEVLEGVRAAEAVKLQLHARAVGQALGQRREHELPPRREGVHGPHEAVRPAAERCSRQRRRGSRGELMIRRGVDEDTGHRVALPRHVRAREQGIQHFARVAAVELRDDVVPLHARDLKPGAEGHGSLTHNSIQFDIAGAVCLQDKTKATSGVGLAIDEHMTPDGETASHHWQPALCVTRGKVGESPVEDPHPALRVMSISDGDRAKSQDTGAFAAFNQVCPCATAAKLWQGVEVRCVEWVCTEPRGSQRQRRQCERLVLNFIAATYNTALRIATYNSSVPKMLLEQGANRRRAGTVALRKP